MNVVQAKEIATSHINVATFVTKSQQSLDYLATNKLEGACIVADSADLKIASQTLFTKISKQYDKMRILRYMVLLSTTQGGLGKADYDSLRRTYIMNYGYQEVITFMNLEEAGLFKLKDKKSHSHFDWQWEKIKT